jgi:hypothetical protein
MANKSEPTWGAGAVVSETRGTGSLNTATLISGQNLPAGSVLGRVTSTGKVTMVAPAAGDGSQTAIAVLIAAVDASAGDAPCAILVGPSEVNNSDLNWGTLTAPQITAAKAQLDSARIRVR